MVYGFLMCMMASTSPHSLPAFKIWLQQFWHQESKIVMMLMPEHRLQCKLEGYHSHDPFPWPSMTIPAIFHDFGRISHFPWLSRREYFSMIFQGFSMTIGTLNVINGNRHSPALVSSCLQHQCWKQGAKVVSKSMGTGRPKLVVKLCRLVLLDLGQGCTCLASVGTLPWASPLSTVSSTLLAPTNWYCFNCFLLQPQKTH